MEEKLKNILISKRISKMINPIILVNEDDLKFFIKKLESEVTNFSKKSPIHYEGILVLSKSHILKGEIIVFDNIKNIIF